MDGTRDAGRVQDGVAADKTRIVEAKYKDATRLLSQLLAKTDHAAHTQVEHVPYELALLESPKLRNFCVLLVNSVNMYQEFLEIDGVD